MEILPFWAENINTFVIYNTVENIPTIKTCTLYFPYIIEICNIVTTKKGFNRKILVKNYTMLEKLLKNPIVMGKIQDSRERFIFYAIQFHF